MIPLYFDTHVNLHAEAFAEDLSDVLARAAEANVSHMLAICDKLESIPAIKAIAKEHARMWRTVGVHPHYAKDHTDLTAQHLVELAGDTDVVAIGETGLDQHYGYSDLDLQVSVFRAHIEAAQTTQLPIVIHTREADDLTGDMLEAAHQEKPFPILMHCYTGGQRLAERALALGAYFSASGILSFKNAVEVRDVISQIPTDRIVLETDCPYLAPVPMRGRRNEPAYLPHVAEAYARLMDLPVETVAETTTQNALDLFKLEARVTA